MPRIIPKNSRSKEIDWCKILYVLIPVFVGILSKRYREHSFAIRVQIGTDGRFLTRAKNQIDH